MSSILRWARAAHSRFVWQVLLIHVGVAWGLLQAADLFIERLGFPDWLFGGVLTLMVVGAPVVVLTAVLSHRPTHGGGTGAPAIADVLPPRAAKPLRRLFTWRNALAGGVLAFAVLGLASVGGRAVRAVTGDPVDWAREVGLPELDRLVNEGKLDSAWWTGRRVEAAIPTDPIFLALRARYARVVDIESEPAGALFRYRIESAADTAWEFSGTSPVRDLLLPTLPLVAEFTAEGYEPVRMLGVASVGLFSVTLRLGETPVVLPRAGSVPEGFVHVAGGICCGVFQTSPTLLHLPQVTLAGFDLARFEVTNREFKRFVDAGGYRRQELWPSPIVIEGNLVPWEDAMRLLVDRTGRPGPSGWEASSYPVGEDDYPVGGVSWYEAAAYAAFEGKQLPTVRHWYWAATPGAAASILPHANLAGSRPLPVGASGAMSGPGTFDMAGNVREWAFNEAQGTRYILGGGWDEPDYAFSLALAEVPWDRSAINGIRLAAYADPSEFQSVSAPIPALVERDLSKEAVAPDAVFEVYRRAYAYDALPLNARVESTDSTSSPDYVRQYVSFDAAYGGERMAAVLWLPKQQAPPYQTILHFTGMNAVLTPSSSAYNPVIIARLTRTGRAVAMPILKGTYERGAGTWSGIPTETAAYRDQVISWVRDGRRTLDYLESREDIDAERIAFWGISWGSSLGPIFVATEPRVRAAVFFLGGLSRRRILPEVDPLHFAPRVRVPTLMVNGRFDHLFPYEPTQVPLFELLGAPAEQKRHVTFETGHGFPDAPATRELFEWLDRYLGVVD